MNNRQQRMMREEGTSMDKVVRLSDKYMETLKKEDITLAETKMIIRRMNEVLLASEIYDPKTPFKDIPLRF